MGETAPAHRSSVTANSVPKVRGFKMASLNIASLPSHIDELEVWMEDQNLDIIAINETRLDSTIETSLMNGRIRSH